MIKEYKIESTQKEEFIKVTDMIKEAVKESGLQEGTANIFLPHTTAGITINDKMPNVSIDILAAFDRTYPENGDYKHDAGNSPAHIKSSILGASCSIIFKQGKLLLGDWQEVYFCEFDGPKNKKMIVHILGV